MNRQDAKEKDKDNDGEKDNVFNSSVKTKKLTDRVD